ncbi:MAG: DUF4381 domain-containing protein [Pseudomonadota bacterium]|nr:DUF4381 domain-containing protein [Pseudomonadota bacterium]MEE3070270.1 DUF4381 domain-containing protein [Pseudomonadota bacterium]
MTPLTPEQQAAFEQLRDIRLPAPVSWWPLAPGWWALIALSLILMAAAIAWNIQRRRTRRYAALREFAALRSRMETEDYSGLATDLAALIRRVALSAQGRHLASLSEAEWAGALEQGRFGLPPDVAGLLAEAPYRNPETLEPSRVRALFAPAEIWIRRVA